ncbi:MAG: hypothetical protein M5U01_07710 [Ardenticatenaceae bacterium]|nr:hypothetical protein [Ardenticatenaceae bacterium]
MTNPPTAPRSTPPWQWLPATLTLTLALLVFFAAQRGVLGAPQSLPGAAPSAWQTPTVASGKHPDAWRFGIGLDRQFGEISDYDYQTVGAGWWADWTTRDRPPATGMEYAQLIRVRETWYPTNTLNLTRTVQLNPGALWLIGNEPDCSWIDCDYRPADDTTYTDQSGRPYIVQGYATVYHDLYQLIKRVDPSARVANGALVQGTPVRIAYLNAVWDAYLGRYGAPMPLDVVNFHNQMVREVYGEWGAGLPRGFETSTLGRTYTAQDNDNMDLVRDHVGRIRQWMKDHSLQDTPLIISEYGILQAPWDGFTADRVNRYMTNTFNYFYFTRDCTLGMPADDCRLVQRWQWFSLNSPPKLQNTTEGWNGGLFDPSTHQITVFGENFRDYMRNLSNAPTPTPVGTLPPSDSQREAEEATLSGGMHREQDTSVSSCAYVTDRPDAGGELTLSAFIPTGGVYYLWARVWASDWSNNDYQIVFDRPAGQTGNVKRWQLGTNGWHWEIVRDRTTSNPIAVQLSQGVHTWTIISQDRGAKFDAFELNTRSYPAPEWLTPCQTTFSVDVPLKTGANLVSLPVKVDATDVPSALSSISGQYSKIYSYQADDATDPWKVWDQSLPDYANDLQKLEVGRGFWLYATGDTTLRLTGQRLSATTVTLLPGASLIGYPRRTAMPLTTALAGCSGKITKVYGYQADDTGDPWKIWDASLPGYANDLTDLRPGYGYWVYASQSCTLNFTD